MNSLRLRLMLMLCVALSLAWGFAAWLSHIEARAEVDKLFDAQLAQSAQILIGTAGHELYERLEQGSDEAPPLHEYEQKIAFQIWEGNHLLLRSPIAPLNAMAAPMPGYSNVPIGGETWRVFTYRDPDQTLVIQAGEPMNAREALARHIALRMFLPSLAALPLLALAIWAAVSGGLLPLRRLKAEVARREVDRLDPLSMQGVPDEVAPLAAALNDLFSRLERAFETERRFTADAAHELRTPLAALKIQAQVALRAAEDEARTNALKNVIHGVDRATHLVEQLLTLARVDPDAAATEHVPVNLHTLAASSLADIAPMAQARHIELALENDAPCIIQGNAAQLSVLLRNLLDNAIRYTPEGGQVIVALIDHPHPTLEVRDTGPGIPEAERSRVLERFYRVTGNAAEGSGLGLSIVRRIAELHHAELTLSLPSSGSGLIVRVVFPL
ncbi:two-component system, OmpR family, sensor histidine kinase QseC [Novimethylophilus kurashikiensis]|uniref:histidine kinase n=1 Tax=Novimethylophilus kurashikiensis TaxID=1825523 RepID=A0A2R5FBQ6_9PROT|nr:ATP-binding protein [Novimethylophilus kurashikiensis]GBG15647.1 two-component system, OmpR family, sensor histidine kinase QseC [Novimethylophilus kurashikiensis]